MTSFTDEKSMNRDAAVHANRRRGGAVCPLCGKETETPFCPEQVLSAEDTYGVYYCTRCDIGITAPVPSREVLSRLYSSGSYRADDGTRFNGFVEALVRCFNAGKKRKIKKLRQGTGAILDVGCGRGLFLDFMRRDGWSVTGVEFNDQAASCAKSTYGIDVVPARTMEGIPAESYDVITLYHVLEHLQDPAAVLRTCTRLLKKQGLLVIAVPNLSSLQASFGKADWFHLDVPYHLHHFTLKGLDGLLRNAAMKVVEVKQFDFEQNVFGWHQTLLNKSGIKKNLLYDLLKKPELRRREITVALKRDIVLTLLLSPVYFPLSLMLSLCESLILRRGGTIHLFAVKQEPVHPGERAKED